MLILTMNLLRKSKMHGEKMLTEKMEVPGMGFTGSFQDTEGNIFGIIEYKED